MPQTPPQHILKRSLTPSPSDIAECYADAASNYVRDLIYKDQECNDKIAAMQCVVDDGLDRGIGNRSKDELFAEAVKRVETPRGSR